ncbi:putative baseplate assembly protein [Sphaerisporangium corydalis]|uniref:Baseplate assembly protein n=1 Tax=Sphaerisporangium corydalis TaxID=1441875 RepID=A0ABV9E9G8_9ACTN|nr:putative baseplate assembly protein [Sphaerisporangium corydalis]
MTPQPPPVDPRDRADLIAETQRLATRYSGWRPAQDGPPDAGEALIGVFARFAELVVERVNRAPDRDYLAFLNLIGTRPLPPLPARVPLTFTLAEGSPADAVVPSGTRVAADPVEGEDQEVVFETEDGLVVTRAALRAVYVGDAEGDAYSDRTTRATGEQDAAFPAFVGDVPVPHDLYVACDPVLRAPGDKQVTLLLRTPDAALLDGWPITWSRWDGAAWRPVAHRSAVADGTWAVTLPGLPSLPPSVVNGISAGWVRGRLGMPLASGRSGIAPEAVASGASAPRGEVAGVYPFGATSQVKWFYLSADDVIAAGGGTAYLDFALSRPGTPRSASVPVRLVWSYRSSGGWRELGRSSSRAGERGTPGLTDTTLALTGDGRVSFGVPADWSREAFHGRLGRWLRVEIDDAGGAYGTLPQVGTLTAGYGWDLPEVTGVALRVDTAPEAMPSPAAFLDAAPVDLSKDFLPFGERPAFNDTFYCACPAELARPGAVLDLAVTLTNASDGGPVPKVRTEGSPMVAWETWNGKEWQDAAAGTDGYAFTGDAVLRITMPGEPVAVNGDVRHWVRARLTAGDYGTAARYVPPASGETGYRLVDATFAPPMVKTLSWRPGGDRAAEVPAEVCVGHNDFTYVTAGAGPFTPFATGAERDPALYLCFGAPFSPRPVTLYLQVEPPAPEDVGADRLARSEQSDPPRVVWEYSGPSGWTTLAAADETGGLSRGGLIRFVGPDDLISRSCFGQDGWWIRGRWEKGQFPYPPRLRRVTPNTTWAAQAVTVEENLGAGNGEPGQTFVTAQTPVLPGQRLVVREPEPPAHAEATALRAAEGTDAVTPAADGLGRDGETLVRWHAVPDFSASGPLDRHYTADPLTGEIRFGDGEAGRLPPRGDNNISLTYRTGGGAHGNRPAGTITRLQSAVPYVDAVTNHEDSQGGTPVEPEARLRARGPKALRHRGRAVTAQDIEDLAVESSPEVVRARAVPPDGFNPYALWLDPGSPEPTEEHLNVAAGATTVIVVPESAAARPIPGLVLLRQVEDHLRARCPATAVVKAAGPEWIEAVVTTTVVAVSADVADPLVARVSGALRAYLHPLTGGPLGEGWDFGRRPRPSDLYSVVEALPGVDHVHSLDIALTPLAVPSEQFATLLGRELGRRLGPGGPPAPEAEVRDWLGRALVCSGDHTITVKL